MKFTRKPGPEPDPAEDFTAWLQWALFYTEPHRDVRKMYAALYGCHFVDEEQLRKVVERGMRVLRKREERRKIKP